MELFGVVVGVITVVLGWLQWRWPRPVDRRSPELPGRSHRFARVHRPLLPATNADARDELPPVLVSKRVGSFVGRNPESSTLRKEWHAVTRGGSSVVVVSGIAGIGKSELVVEFARSVRPAPVIASRASPSGTRAHALVTDLVRQLVAVGDREVMLDGIDDLGLGMLSRLAPDLFGRAEGSPEQSVNPAGELTALHEAIGALLRAASLQEPIVVIVEDLQAATADSLTVVTALVEQRVPRVLFVLTSRIDEAGNDPLEDLADLARSISCLRYLKLRELSESDLVQLTESLAVNGDSAEIGRALHRRTGGHPLFATSLLRSTSREDVDLAERLGRAHIPEDVATHIACRLKRLPPEVQEVLAAGAVIGDEFELDLLANVLEEDLDGSLVHVVTEAERSGLVVAAHQPQRPGTMRFSHQLVHDAIYMRMTAVERSHLHRRVADALQNGYAPEFVANYAHHCHAAAETFAQMRPRSVEASIAAARDSVACLAYGEAVDHYLRGRDHAGSADERALVGAGLGGALWRKGDLPEARRRLEEAAVAARQVQSVELLAEIATTLSAAAFQSYTSDAGLSAFVEEVLELLPEGEVFWRVRLLTALSRERSPGEAPPQHVRDMVGAVIDVATTDDNVATRAYGHLLRHDRQFSELDVSPRLRTTDQLIAAASTARDPHLLCEGYGLKVFAAMERLDAATAQEAIAACDATASRFRYPYGHWQAAVYRAGLALVQRPLAEARAAIEHAREIGRQLGCTEVGLMYAIQSTCLHRELGYAAEAHGFVQREADAHDLPVWRAALAIALCEVKDGPLDDAARPLVEEFTRMGLTHVSLERGYAMTLSNLAQACAYLRDPQGASVLVPLLQACIGRHPVITRNATYCGSMAYHLGLLHATLGDYDSAVASFETAYRLDAPMHANLWICHTLIADAQTHRLRDGPDDPEVAARLEERARRIATEFGYTRAEEQLDGRRHTLVGPAEPS